MRILVPIDFSFESRQALAYAAAIGRLYQKNLDTDDKLEILIFHAFHPPLGTRANFFIDQDMLRRQENQVRNKMRRLQTTIPTIAYLPHRLILLMADAKQGLAQVVEEENVDLVVMGFQSEEDHQYVQKGSTTIHAIKDLSCPVLVVPATTDICYPRYISFATDLESVKKQEMLHFFKKMVRIWKARLDILHVHPTPQQIDSEHAIEALELHDFFDDLAPTYSFPTDHDPVKGLHRYIRENRVDLLAILHRRHHFPKSLFHKSTSLGFLQDMHVPLLILQDQ